ncbi:MAG: V-type ATP synthase subunit E [Halobacteria archaeon]|nr:V-type ATP synthase subunit E [Halobacteria archaeon]
MGLETVVDDITDEARARAEEIREEAEEEAERIVSEAEEEAERIEKDAEEEVENEIQSRREQTLSSAKLEARKMKSRAEKDLLDDLKEDVEERVAQLDEGREDLTERLLESAVDELGSDTGKVYSSERDEETVKDLLASVDGFEYGGNEEMLGGVIVEAEDGEVRINNTFDSVLETVWNDRLKEISSRLFGETEEATSATGDD